MIKDDNGEIQPYLYTYNLDDTLTCHMARTADGSYLHTLTNTAGVVVCELLSQWKPQVPSADVSEVLNREL